MRDSGCSQFGLTIKMMLWVFWYVHVYTSSIKYMPVSGIVRSWGVDSSSTRYCQAVVQSCFTSLYFHPMVYENSSCDISTPLPCPVPCWLKTLLTRFSKTLQTIISSAFLFQEQEAFHQVKNNYIWPVLKPEQ